MTDRPILFSGPMVRALLDGRKTQTRRDLTKTFARYPQLEGYETNGTLKPIDGRSVPCVEFVHSNLGLWHPEENPSGRSGWYVPLKAAVGDRLWVKESWWIATMYSYGTTPGGCEISPPPLAHRKRDPVHYDADGNPPNVGNRTYGPEGLRGGSFAAPDPYAVWLKKPSIHMPRWASRLTLIVTEVRVERLQDISDEDAIAEGIFQLERKAWIGGGPLYGLHERVGHDTAVGAYNRLWRDINGDGSWAANPWVAAYTFTVTKQNIDQIEKVAA
ncbi:hypothetical protein GOE04_24735 [Sinorhizobium medicae]|nr:hypothetical protein [Sinorhizobium medicae]MDX0936621.1 hypothetical protein [Sinorhizobium medicae]MDX0941708.1 hypothetical protein [Sinorhizobium medicae]